MLQDELAIYTCCNYNIIFFLPLCMSNMINIEFEPVYITVPPQYESGVAKVHSEIKQLQTELH